MSTELEVHQGDTLTLSSEQNYWNDSQLAALRHMGVENATEGDLTVFHHVCTRTGLDPFARQIYMIGRNTKDQRTNQWVTKYTIQTGIDGFRLIGRRAADRTRQKISLSAPEWAHEDGSWRPIWRATWGVPVAARVTLSRDGEPFVAVALFDEYKQTKKTGELTAMWSQRPAGQIAKCAEALAWRMAFPQDLSGIYADEEMGQAQRVTSHVVQADGGAAERMAAVLGTPADQPPVAPPYERDVEGQMKAMHASFNDAGITERQDRLDFAMGIVNREITSSNDLTWEERGQVIDALKERIEHPFADEPQDAELVEP